MSDERESLPDWIARMVRENPDKRTKGWRLVVGHVRGTTSTAIGHLTFGPTDDVNHIAQRIEGAIDNERGVFPGRQVYEVSISLLETPRSFGRYLCPVDEGGGGLSLLEGSGLPSVPDASVTAALGASQRHVENLHRANLELTKLVLAQAGAQSRVDAERLKRAEEREDKVSDLYFRLMKADREFEAQQATEAKEHGFKMEAFKRLSQLAPLLLGSKTPLDPQSHPIFLALTEFAESLTEEEIAGMVGHLPSHKQVAILEVIVRLKKTRADAAATPDTESRH